ncbi:uncharacterized protein LOC111877473 [Lactuca sativa]|uniref:uncharacterized protein LOC111877473 n=1 Tax=Lactuca sativa TaxID=4236 RepID=UPI000CD93A6E|nr:uncharacterized protein LOC111877473 [Lactuca sativa]
MTMFSEFGSFIQKPDEKLDQTFNHFNHLLSRMLKYNLEQRVIKQKVTFMNGLRFYEEEVTKEVKLVSSMGSLALVAKEMKSAEEDSESKILESEISKDDKALLVSNPKKFYKKNFSRYKNNFRNDDEKKEKKLLGDSRYDCNYCDGKNHFAKECMLRKQNVKSVKENDKVYYVQKIEELRKKNASNANPALVVQEGSDDDGRVEVWSTDSEDDENRVSEQRGYATDSGQTSESCFAAKLVSEQVKECEKVVDKVMCDEQYDSEWYIDNGCSCIGLKVSFDEEGSKIIEKKSKAVLLESKSKGEMYPLNPNPIKGKPSICLLTKASSDDSWIWHKRLSHLNFKDINKLVIGDHVRGLHILKFDKMTWVFFLRQKSDATPKLIDFIKQVELQLRKPFRKILSDNGSEFKKQEFEEFLTSKVIDQNFSSPYTPHQNDVVERRNCSLCEAAKTMLSFVNLPRHYFNYLFHT